MNTRIIKTKNITLLVIILLIILFSLSCLEYSKQVSKTIEEATKPTSKTKEISKGEENAQICKEIVEEYHKTHTYYGKDIYVCGDMACDVWDMLKTRGINAMIMIGNVEKNIRNATEANHAWVLAEVEPNKWLALETTGGYIVYYKDNPLYYQGWHFYTPKQFKEYLQLLKQYQEQISKYNEAVEEYNRLVRLYNQASFFEKITLKNKIETQEAILNQRAKDLEETITKINNLLSY
jgi:hypothetical protein